MNPVAYRVTLANGRYADRVLKTMCYGRKPKWLVGGWADEYHHCKGMFNIVLIDMGSTTASVHDFTEITVRANHDNHDTALYVAEQLAGKRGTVEPLTQEDLDREFAEAYRDANQ
jgi:hypothetical protein